MNTTSHTLIVCNRSDLFSIVRFGFVPQYIGSLWCEGWVQSDRIPALDAAGITYRAV